MWRHHDTSQIDETGTTMDDELSQRMVSVTKGLRAQVDHLNGVLASSRAATYDAESPDQQVRMTVDGRPRLTGVSISARVIRQHGAEDLGPVLTQVLNDGLAKAHAGTRRLLQADVSGLGDPAPQNGRAR
jgi:DNA-binding protein YbaB